MLGHLLPRPFRRSAGRSADAAPLRRRYDSASGYFAKSSTPEGSTLAALLTDNPILRLDHDRFGFRTYVEQLHEIVANADTLPVTVGVFGPWGSGKSSFMRMWQDQLAFAPENRALWFNPWKYDQKVEVWAALLQSLLAELATEETAARKATRLASAATWLALRLGVGASVSLATGGAISAADVAAGAQQLAATNADYYRELNRFEIDFAEAVAAYLPPEGRLFVFVDDLDRCTPAAAVNVLEALKLFTGDARCVFVLGMDYDLLVQVVAGRFGGDVTVDGAAYLEKIVQLPFFLPEISFAEIRRSVAEHVADLADHDPFWTLVRTGFGNNPRRIKRFVNVLTLATSVLARDASPAGARTDLARRMQLARLLVVRSQHRPFFQHLLRNPGAWQALLEPQSRRGTDLQAFAADGELLRLLGAETASGGPALPPTAGEVSRLLTTVRLAAPPATGS
ncbi:hypothetical protein GCM10010399_90450 [Dactylosporangium fulvum]|uniref:KAP family NTPase n=1 Tax=Dactylosporangium fulvum TaxID=53359 RepID=A0ABY5W4Z7_9ACTN|nr:KAP family NTPase [Dactylosporangium fulvum]UWP85060.1 KAP family NTPase [Dactylosporangium fulvum]